MTDKNRQYSIRAKTKRKFILSRLPTLRVNHIEELLPHVWQSNVVGLSTATVVSRQHGMAGRTR